MGLKPQDHPKGQCFSSRIHSTLHMIVFMATKINKIEKYIWQNLEKNKNSHKISRVNSQSKNTAYGEYFQR